MQESKVTSDSVPVRAGELVTRKSIKMTVPPQELQMKAAPGRVDCNTVHQHAEVWFAEAGDRKDRKCDKTNVRVHIHVVWEWRPVLASSGLTTPPDEVKYRCAVWRNSTTGGQRDTIMTVNGAVHRQQSKMVTKYKWHRPEIVLQAPIMSHANAADGGTGVRIDIGTRNITKALVIVEITQRKLTEPTEELRLTIARRVVQGNIMGEPYFQLRILPEWIRQQGQGAVYQHARAWLYLGKKTYAELGFRLAQMGDMTRRIGSIGVSMSSLVQYEHITKRVGLHHLGQRIYYADTYWHWNNENANLPDCVHAGYAAGWGWFQCHGGSRLGASRCTIALGCKRALLTPHAEQGEWQIVTHLLGSVDHTAWPAQGPVEPWPTWRAPVALGRRS